MTERFYDKGSRQVEAILNTDSRCGLKHSEVRKRRQKSGKNEIYSVPRSSFKVYLQHILTDYTSILLLITILIAIIFEKTYYLIVAAVILIIYYMVAVFTYVKAQRVLEGMAYYALPNAKVMRDGKLYMIKQEQLVQGDIIFLAAGDIVPCDARIVESDELEALEVNLTGVTRTVRKRGDFTIQGDVPPSAQKNMLFASTILTSGRAKAIACAVGSETLVCKAEKNKPIVTNDNLDILQKLRKISRIWSIVMSILIFLMTILDLLLGQNLLIDTFLTALSLAVASMSEFYVIFGFIIVACGIFGAVRKYKDINSGALIKNFDKLSELKKLTCLVVPKEGAFSIRDKRVEKVYANGDAHIVGEHGFEKNATQTIRYALLSTGLYGGNRLIENNISNDNVYTKEEESIIRLSEKIGIYHVGLEEKYPLLDHKPAERFNPCDISLFKYENMQVAAMRGDPKYIIRNSVYVCEYGRLLPMTDQMRSELLIAAELLEKETYKVVAVASRNVPYTSLVRVSACESELTFEGMLAIREPAIPGVAKNVITCNDAGLKVLMMSDDVSESNCAFAEAVGILNDPVQSVTTNEINEMSDGLFRANLSKYRLFQGLTTAQKRKLVSDLKDDGEVVGVLGHNLEEIILLKEADVGYAQSVTISDKAHKSGVDLLSRNIPVYAKYGKGGTGEGCEALKFVSDVIVSEADTKGTGGFNAILESVLSAKAIYMNLKRMMRYLIMSQIARLMIVFYGILTGITLLTPIQILFSGLVMDFAAILCFSFERPDGSLLRLKEKTDEESEHTGFREYIPYVLFGVLWGILSVGVTLLIRQMGLKMTSAQLSAVTFVSTVLTQYMLLGSNKKEDPFRFRDIRISRIAFLMFLMTAGFLTACFLFPWFGHLFGVISMSSLYWILIAAVPAVMLIVYQIYKMLRNTVKEKDDCEDDT